MLLVVTTRCDMGCVHCMASCVPEGEDMTFANYAKAVAEVGKVDEVVILTGGEPLLHRDIWKMVDHAIEKGMLVILTTNGYYLREHESDCLKRLQAAKYRLLVQVTNDSRYYPKGIPDIGVIRRLERHGLLFVEQIESLAALGRAKENGLKAYGRNFPMCTNTILATNQTPDLKTAIAELTAKNKMCHFSIMPNLDIMLSECRQLKLGSLLEPGWEKTVFGRLQIARQMNNENLYCRRCGFRNADIFGMGSMLDFVKKYRKTE